MGKDFKIFVVATIFVSVLIGSQDYVPPLLLFLVPIALGAIFGLKLASSKQVLMAGFLIGWIGYLVGTTAFSVVHGADLVAEWGPVGWLMAFASGIVIGGLFGFVLGIFVGGAAWLVASAVGRFRDANAL